MILQSWKSIKDSFSTKDKWILGIVISLFCTQYVTALALLLFLGYHLWKKNLFSSIQKQPGYRWIYLFIILEIVVSLIASNRVGLINAIGMFLVMAFISVYRHEIHSKLFTICIDVMLIGSIVVGIYALFQFAQFSAQGGYSFFEFHIQNSPKRRIMATFENANLYATMLEFWIFFCVYRFVQVRKVVHKLVYVGLGFFNFGLMYLTGCRTALLPFVVIIPLFFFLARQKQWFVLSLIGLGVGVVLIGLNPDLIPRITDMSTLESRFKIWKCAWTGIQNYPLFGLGPQSYHLYYQMFDGHKAPHAHNIYIDSLSSYGIVGTLMLVIYIFKYLLVEILKIRKMDSMMFGLVVGFLLIFLIHGLLDVTMNVLATSIVFFMVLNMGYMVQKEMEKQLEI